MKKFAVAVFPSLLRLLFQFYQVFFDCVGFRRGGMPVGNSKTKEPEEKEGVFHTATLLKTTETEQDIKPRNSARRLPAQTPVPSR